MRSERKKSKKRRSKVKHPGLKKQYNSKVKQEYLDQDYINELSDTEKDWLNQFNEEYYGAALDYEDLSNNMHNTKELKKDCTDRNNARNRCLYGAIKAMGRTIDIDPNAYIIQLEENASHASNPEEDKLVESIDDTKEKENQ